MDSSPSCNQSFVTVIQTTTTPWVVHGEPLPQIDVSDGAPLNDRESIEYPVLDKVPGLAVVFANHVFEAHHLVVVGKLVIGTDADRKVFTDAKLGGALDLIDFVYCAEKSGDSDLFLIHIGHLGINGLARCNVDVSK
jgi:hypothetical protein